MNLCVEALTSVTVFGGRAFREAIRLNVGRGSNPRACVPVGRGRHQAEPPQGEDEVRTEGRPPAASQRPQENQTY